MDILKHAGVCRLIQFLFLAIPTLSSAADSTFDAEVEYIPDPPEILLGEPLFVTFSVTNKGTSTFYFETGGDYRMAIRSGRFKFKAADTNGIEAKDPHPDATNMGGFLSYQEVKPHSDFSYKFLLSLWIKFDHAGRYRVHAERPLQFYSSASPNRVTNSGVFDFYVTVLPANSNLLGEHIRRWGGQSRIPEQAASAAESLAYVDDERVIPYLLYIAAHYQSDPLESAIEGLGKYSRPDSTHALIHMLGNPEYYYFQYEVFDALAAINSLEARVAVRGALNSSDGWTRSQSARRLDKMNDRDSIDEIKSHLTDSNSDVRLHCAIALVHLGAFQKGLNSPVILAQILDFSNPSSTNQYNRELFELIATTGGPNLQYRYFFRGEEATENETMENRKALAAMQSWANSSNNVPEH